MSDKYELVRFEQNGLTLDVNVSPSEDTVWLSLNEMCILFGRDKSVISRHIRNIFKEGELDPNRVVAKNATTASDGKTYDVAFYDLDMIISVGYRVKSPNGIVFRKWANSILREYLLRGYVVDRNRTLVTNENYINLINKVESIDTRLTKIESEYTAESEKVFFDGEYLDARVFIKELLSKATASIVVIDPYADAKALDFLSSKSDGVSLLLVVSTKAKLTQDDVNAFNLQYEGLVVKDDDSFHDRFILIDNRDLYHLGASLNCAGKKTFAITRLNDEQLVAAIINRINAF
ncbi:MAG: virulence RhuM family protein [Bacilli bacterium]|nr:virulence RhuM family protein [Bacilli bacterium]